MHHHSQQSFIISMHYQYNTQRHLLLNGVWSSLFCRETTRFKCSSESRNQTWWVCFGSCDTLFNWLPSWSYGLNPRWRDNNYQKSVHLGHVRNVHLIVIFFICEHLGNQPSLVVLIEPSAWCFYLPLAFYTSFPLLVRPTRFNVRSELIPLFTYHIYSLRMICCYETIGGFSFLKVRWWKDSESVRKKRMSIASMLNFMEKGN